MHAARALPTVLRVASELDLPTLVELERQPDNKPFILGWPPERHAAALADPDNRYLIIEANGQIVGFLLVSGLAPVVRRRIELRRIVVDRKGVGIGRQALQLLLTWAFARNAIDAVWLDVFADNARALHLYQSIGFGVVEEQRSRNATRPLVVMEMARSAYQAGLKSQPGAGCGE